MRDFFEAAAAANERAQMMTIVGIVLAVLFALALLAAVSRAAHWAHETQRKLDATNHLLAQLLARPQTAYPPPPPPPPPPPTRDPTEALPRLAGSE